MGSWKAGRPKNLIATLLWQAWLWVAWIEEGQQILGTENLRRKIIRYPSLIHNSNFDPDDVRAGLWLPTQYFTLTDSLIFYDIFMSWMSLQEKKSGNGFLKPTNMSHKFPFGSASHLENIDSWKAGSPASNPLWLKAQSRQWFIGLQQSHVTTESAINIQILDTITLLYVTNLGDDNSVTKPSASLHETGLFSSAATKGWAWCKQNAELVERTAALTDLKLLVGSGRLDFPKGMDSWNK